MPRGELLDLVWGAVHVTDDSVTQCVTQIRRALGGRAGVQLRTMSRRGYMLELAQPSGPPEAYPPRVAVSPFVGLGSEDTVAIGQSIANELRVELVKQRSFEMVASARAPSDYRLEGSVRVEAARLRVTAQLVSMRSATLNWAERYDIHIARSTSLATQDEVVKRIVQDVHRAVAG